MDLRDKITSKLEEMDRSKSWLAKQLNVSRQRLQNWLRKNKVPSNHLDDLATQLNCTTDWLLGRDQNQTVLSEKERLLLQEFRTLSEEQQQRELIYLRGLVNLPRD